ncbi:uncharacterized protein LOC129315588 [Prosopis cineraria]|uniref:uncharacterized protein LOC129315588 n=1 Tax=Prosopis cineraria TaxID=364024 RepID=UPI00240FA3C2|nr:uncharacterized protein LOC129315588 [Prosopis cineraria]
MLVNLLRQDLFKMVIVVHGFVARLFLGLEDLISLKHFHTSIARLLISRTKTLGRFARRKVKCFVSWNMLTILTKFLNGGKLQFCAQIAKPRHSDGKAVVQTSVRTSLQCSSSHSSPSTGPFLEALEGPITVNNAAKTDGKAVVQTSASTSLQCSSSHSSPSPEPFLDASEGPIAVNNTTKTCMDLEVGDTSIRKANSLDKAPSNHVKDESTENMGTKEINDGLFDKKPSKKLRKDKNICLDSMFLHRIEDAILDLEELVNRVKWIKGLLECGGPLSSTSQSFWEFGQHIAR